MAWGVYIYVCVCVCESPWAPVSYYIADDEVQDGPRNIGFFYTCDAAEKIFLDPVAAKASDHVTSMQVTSEDRILGLLV
jgi:hypothetical protein